MTVILFWWHVKIFLFLYMKCETASRAAYTCPLSMDDRFVTQDIHVGGRYLTNTVNVYIIIENCILERITTVSVYCVPGTTRVSLTPSKYLFYSLTWLPFTQSPHSVGLQRFSLSYVSTNLQDPSLAVHASSVFTSWPPQAWFCSVVHSG